MFCPVVLCSPQLTHICISKLTNISSGNGLLPGWRQAVIWTKDGILLIWTLGTNFNEILSKLQTFSFKKMHLKMFSGKRWPFCLSINVLSVCGSGGCISHSCHGLSGSWWRDLRLLDSCNRKYRIKVCKLNSSWFHKWPQDLCTKSGLLLLTWINVIPRDKWLHPL